MRSTPKKPSPRQDRFLEPVATPATSREQVKQNLRAALTKHGFSFKKATAA